MTMPQFPKPWKTAVGPINPCKDKFRLMVARFPGNNSEHPESSGYIMKIIPELISDPRIEAVIPWKRSSTPIPMIRNQCVLAAMANHCDYLLMIDSDMEPDCEPDGLPFWSTAWNFLMNRRAREREYLAGFRRQCETDISIEDARLGHKLWWKEFAPACVAAPYCGPGPDEEVYVLQWKQRIGNDDPDTGFVLRNFDRTDAARREGIEHVGAVATGLILYDTRMFHYLPPAWFQYRYTDQYESFLTDTEDVFQTRNANILGMPCWVAWDCWAAHFKPKRIGKPKPISCHLVEDALSKVFREQYDLRQKIRFVHEDFTPGIDIASPACLSSTQS